MEMAAAPQRFNQTKNILTAIVNSEIVLTTSPPKNQHTIIIEKGCTLRCK
jgi:hypothetical protein